MKERHCRPSQEAWSHSNSAFLRQLNRHLEATPRTRLCQVLLDLLLFKDPRFQTRVLYSPWKCSGGYDWSVIRCSELSVYFFRFYLVFLIAARARSPTTEHWPNYSQQGAFYTIYYQDTDKFASMSLCNRWALVELFSTRLVYLLFCEVQMVLAGLIRCTAKDTISSNSSQWVQVQSRAGIMLQVDTRWYIGIWLFSYMVPTDSCAI